MEGGEKGAGEAQRLKRRISSSFFIKFSCKFLSYLLVRFACMSIECFMAMCDNSSYSNEHMLDDPTAEPDRAFVLHDIMTVFRLSAHVLSQNPAADMADKQGAIVRNS